MLTLVLFHLFLSSSSTAQTRGTVPIEVIRLPEYEAEKPKTYDPVAAPVKSFNLESQNGRYQGETSASAPHRRSIAAPVEDTSAPDEDASEDSETTEAPYIEADNTDNGRTTATTTTTATTITKKKKNKKKNGDGERRHAIIKREIEKANKLANDSFANPN